MSRVPSLPSLRMTIASRREDAERVQEALDGLLRQLGLDDAARERVDLAVREAVANAIVHGNHERPEKPVWISAEATEDSLVIRVDDEGDGFDFARVEDPRSPERRLLPHGRGLWLMRTLMDEIVVERRPEGGTSVMLCARLTRSVRDAGNSGRNETP